jgi:hypothetical protein
MQKFRLPAVLTIATVICATIAAATAKQPPRARNLLQQEGAIVAVSSSRTTDTERADHVADDNVASAWRSKPGDVVGAWIAFRVVGKVGPITMTVGDTRGDDVHFRASPRVRKVKVFRDGKPVGVFELDSNNQDPQEIPVAGRGTWKIVVLEVEQGRDPKAKSLVLTEVSALGTVDMDFPARPVVRVGRLDE